MGKKKTTTEDARTSWGTKPSQDIQNRAVTRRDIGRIAAKTVIGVTAITMSDNGINTVEDR